jgi:glucose/arabinose dehydrogenase
MSRVAVGSIDVCLWTFTVLSLRPHPAGKVSSMRRLTVVSVSVVGLLLGSLGAHANAASQDYSLELVVGGLSQPLAVVAEPGTDRLFVAEKGGRIRTIEEGKVTGTFLDISSRVSTNGERGLLGLAFHPDYVSNGKIFVDYTDTSGTTHVVEYTANGTRSAANTSTARTLLIIDQPASNHNGGDLHFGPDGYLYISSGDGGGSTGKTNGQDTSTLLGGLLRIDADTGQAPSTNPFVGGPGADKLWAYGLRNPWRFTIDFPTGNVIIGDVGQNRYEEIDLTNIAEGGVNFGWPRLEGNACYIPATGCATPGSRAPILVYDHSIGSAITGGVVYRGDDLIGYQGHYFYGDSGSGIVRSFRIVNGSATNHTDWTRRIGRVSSLVSFGVDHDGELLLVSLSGSISRLAGPDSPVGSLGRLSVDGGRVTAVGWTFDPTISGESIPVHVYVNGGFAGAALADKPRGDVNSIFDVSGNHGFEATVDASPGNRVCVYGINDGDLSIGNNTLLGCKTVPTQSP